MTSLDAGIGRVFEALGRAGLEENTLVIFSSDNGGKRSWFNWPFSSDKGSLWEGGIRVPAIVRWPGVIPAGRSTEQAAITMDWTATLLDVADTKPDPAHRLDGENLLTVCTGAREPFDRTLFWRTSSDEAARQGGWKYLKESGTDRLFDLSIDPGGKRNSRRSIRTCSTRSGNSMRRGTRRCCRVHRRDGVLRTACVRLVDDLRTSWRSATIPFVYTFASTRCRAISLSSPSKNGIPSPIRTGMIE